MVEREANYLIHYGVKGMKWGVRKDPERFLFAINAVYFTKEEH